MTTAPFIFIIPGDLVWRQKAERGSDLSDIFNWLAEKNALPEWDSFFMAAHRDGANLEKLARTLAACVRDSLPRGIADAVCAQLPLMPDYTRRKHG